jgi:predicted dehydrogenase
MNKRNREMNELTVGILGAGAFAGFAARAFGEAPGVRVVAVCDTNKEAAARMARELSLTVFITETELLASESVRLIYIATPPALHYEQTKRALLAGKHVICEKPAALRTTDAKELAALAGSRNLVYAVNLMQRYNPLFRQVKRIMEEDILGSFLHGFFENYASDENLDDRHWFWDPSLSGGIFIEHGVHFFDLFAGWLGEGCVAGAWEWERPQAGKGQGPRGANKIIDRVQASVLYKAGMVNFYHGFDQPRVLDRQEMRLQFERGDLTLREWVPASMRVHAVLQKGRLDRLGEILGEFRTVYHDSLHAGKDRGAAPQANGRSRGLYFEDHVTLEHENRLGKQGLYRQMLTAMIADQFARIRNPGHIPVIDEHNGVRSLEMAEEATRMAAEEWSSQKRRVMEC